MKKRLVILANSFREGERCIAGIDIDTGAWVRPVSNLATRAITWQMRNINGREPELLDVVEVSLQNHGPDDGCQPENRTLDPIPWKKVAVMTAREVLRYCEDDEIILHNHDDFVEASYFEQIPKSQWKSLQLVHPINVQFHPDTWERKKWRALLKHGQNMRLDLAVTDPRIIERLDGRQNIREDCLLTISLAGPWTPDGIQPKRCYKLVAGVIEL